MLKCPYCNHDMILIDEGDFNDDGEYCAEQFYYCDNCDWSESEEVP